MIENATQYLNAGLSVLPANRQMKYPCISSWKRYQERLPTQTEVQAWFSNTRDGLCIITGPASGNLEMIDFDLGGELFDPWGEKIKGNDPELLDQLVVETTQSGGWHVIYRCETEVSGSMKLAQRRIPIDAKDIHLKKGREFTRIQGKEYAVRQDEQGKHVVVTLIETRGRGGLFLCDPTAGYELVQGDFAQIPVLSESQRDTLLTAAWELNEYIPKPIQESYGSENSSVRPGDDYNTRGNVAELLRSHGWQLAHTFGDNQRWRRPGKEVGWSATLRTTDKVFYVFSSNAAPFEADKPYSPFMTYTLLEHNGDFSKAASALSKQGYGQKEQPDCRQDNDVDLSGLIDAEPEPEHDDETFISKIEWEGIRLVTLEQMITNFQGLNKPIIHGLLREGETMNIIAAPKVGKSWLVNSLSIAVASGLDWLGFKVDPERVLLIDNELHANTTAYRYKEVSRAMGLEPRLYHKNLVTASLRGKLKDLDEMQGLFNRFRPHLFKVIIIDAFYRILPEGTDENDNGAIARLYNSLDRYADRLKCAFILIHHTSKGNQSQKSITDVGAGAGSQARAVDSHLILRPHESPEKIVMDAATRSWPPPKPMVLRKEHPLFEVDEDADPTALQGAAKSAEPKSRLALEEFVESCVASQDPCLLSDIVRLAGEELGLSERKSKELLDCAVDQSQVVKFKAGARFCYARFREGFSGDKGQWVAALLAHHPDLDTTQIAEITGASERYIRRLKSGTEGGTG